MFIFYLFYIVISKNLIKVKHRKDICISWNCTTGEPVFARKIRDAKM